MIFVGRRGGDAGQHPWPVPMAASNTCPRRWCQSKMPPDTANVPGDEGGKIAIGHRVLPSLTCPPDARPVGDPPGLRRSGSLRVATQHLQLTPCFSLLTEGCDEHPVLAACNTGACFSRTLPFLHGARLIPGPGALRPVFISTVLGD